jgi:hypothetical protein
MFCPDTMQLTPALEREFRSGENARFALAAVAQEKLNAAVASEPARMIDGVGQLIGRVDADAYWAMRLKHGPDCWNDPAFRRMALRDGLMVKPSVVPKVSVAMGCPR